ncbi:hypothetical protein PMAG_b0301 [Pseudoalteromonas mariniglutinosa NCIMB 1770]|nr:hypothetical protein [Pseudoalteromonas mariniglutinosa NCIMB 1770]
MVYESLLYKKNLCQSLNLFLVILEQWVMTFVLFLFNGEALM